MSENEIKAVEAEVQTVENAENQPSKKKSGWKLALKIIGGVLIALIVILLLAVWQIDWIASTATRKIGTMVTGTPVDVKSINIKPFAVSVKVDTLTVGNPEGFLNPTAIKVGNFYVAVNLASVLTDKIIVENLEISDVAIDMETTLSQGSNFDALLKNVEKNTGLDKKKAEAAAKEEDNNDAEKKDDPAAKKQVIIRKLTLKDSKITVSNSTLKTTMSIPLMPISLENVGEGTDLAGTIQEIFARIMGQIGNTVNFDAIGKGFVSGADAIGKGAGAVGDGIVSGVEGAGKAVDGAVESTVNLFKKLPGLGN